MANCVGSLQAVERMTAGFRAGAGHDGLGPGQAGSLASAGEKQCHVGQKVHGNVAVWVYRTVTCRFSLNLPFYRISSEN